MYTKDVIAHFSPSPTDQRGAKKEIARILGISSGALSQWGELVPEGQAYKLESLTNKALLVDPSLYAKKVTNEAA